MYDVHVWICVHGIMLILSVSLRRLNTDAVVDILLKNCSLW